MDNRILIHDVSHWQGDLSRYWDLFKQRGCKAIIIKMTEGLAYWNIAHEHARQAKEAGFLLGTYHYFRQQIKNSEGSWYTCDPLKQANNYHNWVVKSGIDFDLPPALDVEEANNPYLSGDSIYKTLCHIERLFGRTPLIYSRENILRNKTNVDWKRFPLWLANYNDESKIIIPAPWDKWTIWQWSQSETYTPEGSTNKKAIDHNWFNGAEADLYTFCFAEGEIPTSEPKEFVKVKNSMKSDYLRFRNRPELYPGTTLVVGRGDILKLLENEKVTGDIDYWHVELDGYRGYVSAGNAYTELI